MSIALQIHNIYSSVNPLNRPDKCYQQNVHNFLDQLHKLLYRPQYKYSLHEITTDNYFFITQVCVLGSFDVFERVDILNNKDTKPCKIISNRISRELLHNYIVFLRQHPPYLPYYGPYGMPMMTPVTMVASSTAAAAATPAAENAEASRFRKKIEITPKHTTVISKPQCSKMDTVPLNFYTVFGSRSTAEQPSFHPVPVYPPPPCLKNLTK